MWSKVAGARHERQWLGWGWPTYHQVLPGPSSKEQFLGRRQGAGPRSHVSVITLQSPTPAQDTLPMSVSLVA